MKYLIVLASALSMLADPTVALAQGLPPAPVMPPTMMPFGSAPMASPPGGPFAGLPMAGLLPRHLSGQSMAGPTAANPPGRPQAPFPPAILFEPPVQGGYYVDEDD